MRKIWVLGVWLLTWLTPLGAQTVNTLTLTQSTRDRYHAATDDSFEIEVESGRPLCKRRIPHIDGWNERERGRTDTYRINVGSCGLTFDDVGAGTIRIRTLGTNAWLPSHFRVDIEASGGLPHTVLERSWSSSNWFSQDPDDGVSTPARAAWNIKAPTTTVGPATALLVRRSDTFSATTRCQGTFEFSGTLISSSPNASGGKTSFSKTMTVNQLPDAWSGTGWACDFEFQALDLRPGVWRLSGGQNAGICSVSLPLQPSEYGQVNFRSGRADCKTGDDFP